MNTRWAHNQEAVSCLRACPFQYRISEFTVHIYNQCVIVIWRIWLENDKKNAWTEVKRSIRKLQATENSEIYKFEENMKMLPHIFISFTWPGPLHYRGFTTILRDITIGRTRLDELTACRKRPLPDNTQYSQQTVIPPPPGFELTIPARERLRTRAWDRAARIGIYA